MREIKFRGKRIDTGKWLYGYLIGNDVIVGDIVEFSDEYFNTEFWYKVDPETVGQYTGLKDKNGKEIYEGDVLINPKGIRGEIKYVPEHAAFLAYWKHDGECGYDYLDKGILMKCEVIGNIYETPELLKGDENE